MSAQMQGNPYIIHLETTPTTDAESQMNATLALAFEQRTANLIAFYGMIPRGALDNETIRLRSKLIERLGLK